MNVVYTLANSPGSLQSLEPPQEAEFVDGGSGELSDVILPSKLVVNYNPK